MTPQDRADRALSTVLAQTTIKTLAPGFRMLLKGAITRAIESAVQDERSQSADRAAEWQAERGLRHRFPRVAHAVQGLSIPWHVKS